MDELDRTLLSLLTTDARMPLSTLARRARVARSTVQARLERLETNGTIAGYTVRLGEAAQAGRIRATVLLTLEPQSHAAVVTRLRAVPEVESAHTIAGRVDLLLSVAAPSTRRIDEVLDIVAALPGVRASESLVHLATKLDRQT